MHDFSKCVTGIFSLAMIHASICDSDILDRSLLFLISDKVENQKLIEPLFFNSSIHPWIN